MSCTSIAETENGETGVLSLSTTFMRQVFSRFGEVILVDGTHKTSRYNYELLAFITMNNFGEGYERKEIQAGVGKVSAVDASQIDAVVHEMVYAASQEEYDTTWDSMRRISVSMTQCVEALVASDRWTEKEYKNEMANVMRFTTYCVAEQMEPQYAATLSKSENYKYEVSTDDPDELYASSMPSYNCVPSALTFLCACYSMVLH
ncbi:hypothetical protein PC122_g10302 [Phytophthora cactorum]|nr:hypothetical protein PC122_g10302 [Phytophthora cactorum]